VASLDHSHVVRTVDIADDGRYVLTGGLEKKVRLFDLQGADPGKAIRVLEGNSNDVKCALLDAIHG
jgi:serine-threonine kinase receptor-associated protein